MWRLLLTPPVVLWLAATCAQAQTYAGPKTLGPFRIDKDVSMSSLFARLGRPSSTNADTFCYRSADRKVFLTITRMSAVYDETVAGSVTLSSSQDCINHAVHITTDELAGWKTDKDIGLYSSEEEVERAYGEPSRIDGIEGADYGGVIYGDLLSSDHPPERKLDIGSKALVYRGAKGDLSTAEFGIKDGRVVWISLSYSE